ncbi:replication-associated recombination protein A [Clostridium algidicarnis]|nr:replication-associated recombination protein A [Clostridium algidicarnis]MBU3203077.1 replication-associated recombination protein A [Clostridium algidicarnis]MBU3211231.1 replication-associated recombination protein A [Clostridium algidicarnis]MBU3222261.1 replication-associated recombination protein A [Clostridium algidicarnis]
MNYYIERVINMRKPLADKLRPNELNEVVGQKHILGNGKILDRILKSGRITNMIFYGPPGVGKTTVANIIAKKSNKTFYKLNATNSSLKDIQQIVSTLDTFEGINGILLYLDEIQNFNKKQQQSLLEFIEDGRITLISSTTENPYHYIFKAILSRSTIFEFKPVEKGDMKIAIDRVIEIINKEEENINVELEDEAKEYIVDASNGDVRKAINALEIGIYSTPPNEKYSVIIDLNIAKDSTQTKVIAYDMLGDNHYDILSAFQKSIRGSDVDAALHYLARLIKAGDLISICRRILVIASEDIGLAYPNAIAMVKSCVDCSMMLGFPEARIPLAQAVILLATSPKSNSVVVAIDRALDDLEKREVGDIPIHIKDAHYSGAKNLNRGVEYKYPHNYKNNYVQQQYLPNNIKDSVYYEYGNNKMERTSKEYWDKIK